MTLERYDVEYFGEGLIVRELSLVCSLFPACLQTKILDQQF